LNPLLFAILFALVCVAAFVVGLRFFRTTEARGEVTVEQAQRFGRLLMMASTALFLFLVAVIVHGDLRIGQAAKVLG
jgi:hypothetical protein